MTEHFSGLVRLAATLVVVANAATLVLQTLDDESEAGVLIAVAIATIGPLLVALANITRTTWVLPAFVSSLIGLGAGLGVVGLGALVSSTLVFALVVVLLVCVGGTLVRAQASHEEPRNGF